MPSQGKPWQDAETIVGRLTGDRVANQIVTCECACRPDQPLTDGSFPTFYADETKLRWMFEKLAPVEKSKDGKMFRHRSSKKPFWALHLDGQHVVNITYEK
jgi:hypothetical protein